MRVHGLLVQLSYHLYIAFATTAAAQQSTATSSSAATNQNQVDIMETSKKIN